MVLFRYSIFLLLFFIFACRPEEKAPELPIPHEKLIPVLTDAYIAEAAINSLTGEIKDSMAEIYYEQIFEIHEIKRIDFDTTISIMQAYPNFMDTVYARVLERLTELDATGVVQ